MIEVNFTRNQILELMNEFSENHWMQTLLLEALTKHNAEIRHNIPKERKVETHKKSTFERNMLLTAADVPLHRAYDGTYYKKEYAKDEKVRCDFDKSWSGKCNMPSIKGGHQCLEHFNIECSMCKNVATTDCAEPFQFVCGAPLCNNHANKHDCVQRNSKTSIF